MSSVNEVMETFGSQIAEASRRKWHEADSETQVTVLSAGTGVSVPPPRALVVLGSLVTSGDVLGWLRVAAKARARLDRDLLVEWMGVVAMVIGETLQMPMSVELTADQAIRAVPEETWQVMFSFQVTGQSIAGEAMLWIGGEVWDRCSAVLGGASSASEDTPGDNDEPWELLDGGAGGTGLQLLLDVPLMVSVELGSTERPLRDILQLAPGKVIQLNRTAGEPVDVLVNGRPVARAEVVVVDETYGVRITEIVTEGLEGIEG